jgi:hypothetical protein
MSTSERVALSSDPRRESRRLILSMLIGVLAVPAALVTAWVLVPHLIGTMTVTRTAGMLTQMNSVAALRADCSLSFLGSFALMWLVLAKVPLHGTPIAVLMMLCGWGIYLLEVGGVGGMMGSEYPRWYELLSFLSWPLALLLALYLHRRTRLPRAG